jgi:teichuronic acid biosynthesis glycosyltransferase TuaG
MTYFSVVIPCFNIKDAFKKTVESLNKQTDRDFEVIFVDDCSDKMKLQKMKLELTNALFNYKIIELTQNQGAGVARNCGILQATGKYICLLDSDDYWHPKKLETIKNFINIHNCDFLSHNVETIGFMTPKETTGFKIYKTKDFIISNKVFTSSLVINRSKIELFDPSMRHCEDYDFILRNVSRSDLYFINEILSYMDRPVLSAGGLSSNLWQMRKGEIRTYIKFCILNKRRLIYMPFLIVFSLLKHFKRLAQISLSWKN